MTKYYILYRDFGYSERGILGVTADMATAERFRADHDENEIAECELTAAGAPLPTQWLD